MSSRASANASRKSKRTGFAAAIILWNTRYLEAAFTEIDTATDPDLMRHVAPLGWEHISLTGDYIWDTREQFIDGRLRPLRKRISLLAA